MIAAPTMAPSYVATNPVSIAGPDVAGSSATLAVDSTRVVPVLVLGAIPAAGQDLVAKTVQGRWVSRIPAASGSGSITVSCHFGTPFGGTGANCTIAASTLTLTWHYYLSGTTTIGGSVTTTLFAAGTDHWTSPYTPGPSGSIFEASPCGYVSFTLQCAFGRWALGLSVKADAAGEDAGSNCGPGNYPEQIYFGSGSTCSPLAIAFLGHESGSPTNAAFADGVVTP